jgi:ribosome-binding protein aMBF1 (putative translation factor)
MKSLRKEAAAARREQGEDILSLERPARLRKEAAVDGLDEAFALAICVLRGRISALPPEDKNDLYELLPSLLGDDEEERESAQQTVKEILDQSGGRIRPLELPIHPAESLRNWIEFISRRIRERRLSAGLTQEQLAAKAGLPQSHISRLESGQHSPTAKTLEKIASALGVSVSVFDPSVEQFVERPVAAQEPRLQRGVLCCQAYG